MHSDLSFEVIATGNELLDSSVLDIHTQRIAKDLRDLGFRLQRACIVNDDERELQKVFCAAAKRSRVVIVTGGLGPTDDDLSLQVAAKSFGKKLIHSKEAEKNVKARLSQLGRKSINAGHRKQMLVPETAKVLPNAAGTAPGVELSVGESRFYFLPGVPVEFDFVFRNSVIPVLQKLSKNENAFFERTLKVFGWPESELSELVKSLKIPQGLDIGFRTVFPENHIKIRTSNSRAFASKAESFSVLLKKRLSESLFAEDDTSFEESILRKAIDLKIKLAFAESCTGGLASSMLTKVPGSSAVLERSFVVYSNEAKQELLDVSSKSLEKFGAVSREVVLEMAEGALKFSRADRAVSISGIAGPGGGSSKKPVGSVWFAYADRNGLRKSFFQSLQGLSRQQIQVYSAYLALKWATDPKAYPPS